jgi:hypothetical protein
MSTRSESLAEKVEQTIKDLLASVEASTPEQWAARCSDGEWTQAVAAFHAATTIAEVPSTLAEVAGGKPFPKMTMEELDAKNAVQAQEHADCTVAEVAGIIRASAADAVTFARSLRDGQLDIKVKLMDSMPEVSLEWLVEMGLKGHTEYHLGTITGAR